MNDLSEAQRNFIPHLLKHCDAKTASENTGLDEATINKWLRDPHFREEMKWRRRQIAERVMDMISNAVTKAVQRLVKIVEEGNDQHGVKAAAALIDYHFKGIDQYELKTRMEEIEKKIGVN